MCLLELCERTTTHMHVHVRVLHIIFYKLMNSKGFTYRSVNLVIQNHAKLKLCIDKDKTYTYLYVLSICIISN